MSFSNLARCAVPVVVALAASVAPASAESGTVVPMRSVLRACDFSPIPDRASMDRGTASAVIHTSGNSVSADVQFAEPSAPNSHFDVALIQAPRASSSPCDGPGPGVAMGSLNTNGAGIANTTVSGTLSSGATGAWVFIRQANPYSQSPQEFYTSDFIKKF
jgi:hypothetical protein